MPAADWEDLDDFLDVDEFAEMVTVRSGGTGPAWQLKGIFSDAYLNAQTGEYELDSSAPRLLCKAVDCAGITRGDTVQRGAVVYDVLTSPQPDGTGLATIVMGARHG